MNDSYSLRHAADPEAKLRAVGRAIAEVVGARYGRAARGVGLDMALDSGAVQEMLARDLLDELDRAGIYAKYVGHAEIASRK